MPNDTVYVGIDPGLTCTTIVMLQDAQLLPHFPKTIEHTNGLMIDRLKAYRANLQDTVLDSAAIYDVVVCIEKPGYNLRGASANLIALYWYLLEGVINGVGKEDGSHNNPIYVAAPNSLKKFATSKGNAAKSVIGQAVERKWGDVLPDRLFNDNEIDAFVLAKMAECATTPSDDQWTEYQRESIQKVERYV